MTETRKTVRRRSTIPPSVRDEVLRESGYMCANPRCRHILTLELHHMVWIRRGGGSEATNLIALCPNCHSLHTHGHIPATAIRHWKGILHALNHAFNKDSIDLLLFLYAMKDEEDDIWYSSDGILRFAGLIAAGFVGLAETATGDGMQSRPGFLGGTYYTIPPMTAHRVSLTEKGRAFVKAWMQGDENAFKKGDST